MYKILTCNCNRILLDRVNASYTYSFYFDDCHCNVSHKTFATRCGQCLYNVVGFGRNYFSSMVSNCRTIEKILVWGHCSRLLHDINYNTLKICISEKNLPKEMKLIEIDKYLEMCLKTDPIFFYSERNNKINISIDALDWDEFFYNKETM